MTPLPLIWTLVITTPPSLPQNLYLGPLKEDKKPEAEQDDSDSKEESKSTQEGDSTEMKIESEGMAAMDTGAVAEPVTLETLEQLAGAGKDALDQSE